MNAIYAIVPQPTSDQVALNQVWSQNANSILAAGYTSLVPVHIGGRLILYAYNKATQKTDTYELSGGAPWVQRVDSQVDLSGSDAWDSLSAFVLGNDPYLMAYCRDSGAFGFYSVADDLSVSRPYSFLLARNTPTKGFSTVAPFTSLGGQYLLGYDFDSGTVATFSLTVTTSSTGGAPPLRAQNIWYHQWAKGWTRFAFFQLGGANFFFKINTAKLNVNIDHLQDDPSAGSVEVGSHLEKQLPNALSIDIAAALPWADGEPYLLTYIASSGLTAVYSIHADCLGWSKRCEAAAIAGVSQAVPYRIGDTTYTLFYGA